ncbi:uncharacterized protein F4807DRAFT_471446 [Annulohypoxylon truncatum]|uniref:uncharacterized protein n=1 Tax=Annulohypoxylon truncatum TaxID=327061 RepID=UPI002007E59B|nr:uncharacterized protein F4807DRAFT_471446 [Annulohypoxylon truncatum]KAI1212870.1 hypothetical protein F4807DRAFT_471446 [Annulohypoxylon truncatum]
MEKPKRQKWLDVYDEESGTYIPQLIQDEKSPVLKSTSQALGKSINEDITKELESEETTKEPTNEQTIEEANEEATNEEATNEETNEQTDEQTIDHGSSPISGSTRGNVDSNATSIKNPSEGSASIHEEKNSSHISNAWERTSEEEEPSHPRDVPDPVTSTIHEQDEPCSQDQTKGCAPQGPMLADLVKDLSPRVSLLAALVRDSRATESTQQATMPDHTSVNPVSPSPLDFQEGGAEQGFRSLALKGNENEDWDATWCDRAAYEPYYGGDFDDEFNSIDGHHTKISEHLAGNIKDWVQTTHEVTNDITTDLHPQGIKEPESWGVNPETGTLMNPIEHPVELKLEERIKGVDQNTEDNIIRMRRDAHKRAQRQAAMKILEAEIENDQLKAKGLPGYPFYSVQKTVIPQETASQQEMTSQPDKASQEDTLDQQEAVGQQEEASPQETVNPREIRAPIHLRPTVPEDLPQIAEIYNREFMVIPDKHPVKATEFLSLYGNALKYNLPFIVAVNGWYNPKKGDGQIVGFALMDTAIKGITGSHQTRAEGAGKLIVIVHQDYRRLNICSAMLDAILYCCSINYKPRLGYQVVNPSNDHRFMKPEHNPGQWNNVDIEAIVESRYDQPHAEAELEYKWISDYLKKYFQMSLVSHDVALYKLGNTWRDRITFRHRCRPLDSDS